MLNNNSLELLPQHKQSNNNNKKYEETLYVVPEIFLVERDRHTFVLKNSFLYVPNSSWRYLYCSVVLNFTFHGSFKAVFLVSLSGPSRVSNLHGESLRFIKPVLGLKLTSVSFLGLEALGLIISLGPFIWMGFIVVFFTRWKKKEEKRSILFYFIISWRKGMNFDDLKEFFLREQLFNYF